MWESCLYRIRLTAPSLLLTNASVTKRLTRCKRTSWCCGRSDELRAPTMTWALHKFSLARDETPLSALLLVCNEFLYTIYTTLQDCHSSAFFQILSLDVPQNIQIVQYTVLCQQRLMSWSFKRTLNPQPIEHMRQLLDNHLVSHQLLKFPTTPSGVFSGPRFLIFSMTSAQLSPGTSSNGGHSHLVVTRSSDGC